MFWSIMGLLFIWKNNVKNYLRINQIFQKNYIQFKLEKKTCKFVLIAIIINLFQITESIFKKRKQRKKITPVQVSFHKY